MAPAPPTTTSPGHRRAFLRSVLVALAIVRPASSELFFQPPPDPAAGFAGAVSPPADGGGGSFNVTTSLLFVGLVLALFLLGFLSAYLRRCAAAAAAAQRGGAVRANAAVAAAAAAAFASATNGGGRRRAGLDVAAMEALPVLTYATARAVKAGRGALECAVCLTEFADDGEKLRLLPGCCHVFHATCIDVWLATQVTCPVCRADLADPAVAAAGHVLAADLAAQAQTLSDHTVVDVETPESTPGGGSESKSDEQAESAEERVDRYTLRLPEGLRSEIEEAKRLRRVASAVTAATSVATPSSSGRWASSAFRTMSAAQPSRRWSALLRALSGPRRNELGGSRRVSPLQTHATAASDGEWDVEEAAAAAQEDDAWTHMKKEKHYAHSLTFAGFVIDGDVAAGDWNPEIFHVSTAVPAARHQENATF